MHYPLLTNLNRFKQQKPDSYDPKKIPLALTDKHLVIRIEKIFFEID